MYCQSQNALFAYFIDLLCICTVECLYTCVCHLLQYNGSEGFILVIVEERSTLHCDIAGGKIVCTLVGVCALYMCQRWLT